MCSAIDVPVASYKILPVCCFGNASHLAELLLLRRAHYVKMSNVGCMLGARHSYFCHVGTLMFSVLLVECYFS